MALPPFADQHLTLQVRNTAGLLLIAIALQLPVIVSASLQPGLAVFNLMLHSALIALAVWLAWRHYPLPLPRLLLCIGYLSFICCSVFIWRSDVYTQHFLLVGAMTCGFLFHRSEYRRQRLWTLSYGLAFLAIEAYFVYPLSAPEHWVRLSNAVTLTLTTFAIVFTLGYMNIKRWQQVRAAYAKTREALAQIVPDEPLPEVLACQSGDRVRLPCVCVLFADLAGFQKMSVDLDDDTMVSILDALYQEFDLLAHKAGVTRLKTNGDEYMAAIGLSRRSPASTELQCQSISHFAQALLTGFQRVAQQFSLPCHIRIGIACGPVTAGVIGRQRPTLDIWGRTVNFASELEHAARHDEILVNTALRTYLQTNSGFSLSPAAISTKLGPASAWRLCPVQLGN